MSATIEPKSPGASALRRLTHDRFARLLDRTSQPFIICDMERRLELANGAFERLLGYGPGELAGRGIEELTPPQWHETTRSAVERLLTTGEAQRYEKEYLHRDGYTVPVSCVTDLERDEENRPLALYAFVTDETARLRAEEELRAKENLFRELYDEAPFGYHVIDTEGTILSVNRTECEMLGFDRDEMVGRSIFDFVEESQRDEVVRSFAERVRGDRPVQADERRFRTRDGRVLIVHVESRLLRDREGNVIGVRSMVQDITERKKTEAALVVSERRLRALFEGIDDVVFVHDHEGRILDANPAASRRLGYTREEFLKLNTRDVDDPEFAAGFADRLETQLRNRQLSCEGRHRTKDGRVIPVDINTSTIQFEGKQAVLAVIRDITERKALEETRRQFAEAQARYAAEMEDKAQRLAQSEARYRQLSESLLDALVVTDAAGCVTLFNPAAERCFGYRADEVLGIGLSRLVPDDPAAAVPSLERALAERDPRIVGRTVELCGLRKSGERFPLEVSVGAVEAGGATEFVASIRDQTERHRMRAMIMHSEKLASIGLLSAGIAHEINNPLSYIANNLAVLERDLASVLELASAYEQAATAAGDEAALQRARALAEEIDWDYVRANAARIISRTREGVQRVANIVNNMRGMARTAPPRLEPASLFDLLDTALEMLQPRLRRSQIELSVERQAMPKLACVPSQISQVMINLLVNAVQAIESRPPSRDDPRRLSVALRVEAGQHILVVEDTGVGMLPEEAGRIFDPFYTTKSVGEGTGLGLAISHGIVTGHGGRIEVETAPGVGTKFRVILPARPVSAVSEPNPAR